MTTLYPKGFIMIFFRFLFVTIFIVALQSQQSDEYVKYEFFRNATAKLTYGVKNNKL